MSQFRENVGQERNDYGIMRSQMESRKLVTPNHVAGPRADLPASKPTLAPKDDRLRSELLSCRHC